MPDFYKEDMPKVDEFHPDGIPPARVVSPELRERAMEMALRTPLIQGYNDVIFAAEKYVQYILNGDQE